MEPGSSRENPIVRPSARALLFDPRGRVLLFRVAELDEDSGRPFWITPGGGLEEGEDHLAAVQREVVEETGLRSVEIGPCVWVRNHSWLWEDVWLMSSERYYLARTTRTEISESYRTELELQALAEHRWWTIDEIAASTDVFVPRRLAELLPPLLAGEIPAEPFDTGV
ncbi:MAG: NUDIX domain-containing protein [Chloroflexi bacterium]|nr:NUDIX domain-containing protein [Chloroflexota bacterium]